MVKTQTINYHGIITKKIESNHIKALQNTLTHDWLITDKDTGVQFWLNSKHGIREVKRIIKFINNKRRC